MRYTIRDLQNDFPDDNACLEWLKDYLYPEGIHCKKCDKITPHHRMKTRKSYSCEICGHHFHPTAGTIFHKSRTPLTLWFYAVFLMSNTRSGISAKQLERELGVTYKTAWRMFHQIRKMMASDDSQLEGEVEVDEMYLGGNPMKRTTAKPHNHQVVFGMVERGGRAKVKHVKSSGARVLQPQIVKDIGKTAVIYSDEYPAYKRLPKFGYTHSAIKHLDNQYVNGQIHTQNIENLWSHIKRGIKGVYRHVDPQYLQNYVDEYAFRYSNRNHPSMFWALLGRIGKTSLSD
jgi:transposase-like protein